MFFELQEHPQPSDVLYLGEKCLLFNFLTQSTKHTELHRAKEKL